MTTDNTEYNPNTYWQHVEMTYAYYPSIRHRKRFVINQLKKIYDANGFIFDYGCGIGGLLSNIKRTFDHPDALLGGCDISKVAVEIAQKKIKSPYLSNDLFPALEQKCDIITCIEVIEHTEDYMDILKWINENLKEDGKLILTSQAGKVQASDKYTGHTQHFKIKDLLSYLKEFGFSIDYSSLWGFPLFSMQKYLTNFNFNFIKNTFLEGKVLFWEKVFYSIVTLSFYIHDAIPFGPQIYIVATKN